MFGMYNGMNCKECVSPCQGQQKVDNSFLITLIGYLTNNHELFLGSKNQV